MPQLYYTPNIQAFWPARKQSRDECVRRISESLQRLSRRHPLYSQWYKTGYSVAQALRYLVNPASAADIERHLMDKRVPSDEPDMCHFGGAWNGEQVTTEASSIRWHVGGNSHWISNTISLSVPEALMNTDGRACVAACLRDLVEIWNPQWAGVYYVGWEVEHKNALPGTAPEKNMIPMIGWMTYLRVTAQEVHVKPPSWSEPCGKGGVIVTTAAHPIHGLTTEERPWIDGVVHAFRAAGVECLPAYTLQPSH